MRRLICLLAGVLFCVVALGSDSPKEYDDRTEAVAIEGDWRLTEFEFKGAKATPSVHGVLTYRGGIFSLKYGGIESLGGTYRIDATQKPPHIDWIPASGELKGKALLLIYQIDGDTLRLGFMTGGAWSRPQGFNGDGVAFETYKRVKK
jgi:uncharacterized protein (TIGR03067 family)